MQTTMDGLLPKDATRVTGLISHTACAGQGVTVAVLDTGVDPGAPGLSTTPDGRRKIVDLVDCTGSGDVDMTTLVRPSPENTIQGLSGRTLSLGSGLRALNPSLDFRVGVKRAYDLFPGPLVRRLKSERRKEWDTAHRAKLNAVRNRLTELRLQEPAFGDSAKASGKLLIDEFEAQQAGLVQLGKSYDDLGPIYDCVVFHDGERWRAVVDTKESADLSTCAVLEDYAVRCNYAEFSSGILMHYGVNIYDDGALLSIVVDGGSHGTHVAGILTAHYPDAPEMSGLAPAAQIVSLKIGHTRLSGMQTHRGAMRALAYLLDHSGPALEAVEKEATGNTEQKAEDTTAVSRTSSGRLKDAVETPPAPGAAENQERGSAEEPARVNSPSRTSSLLEDKFPTTAATPPPTSHSRFTQKEPGKNKIRIDVANMSFGRPSREPNRGRFVDVVNRLVYKHNVMFVCSAGNNGPALSSVSAPGGTTDALIGVGAYITPEMLTQAYSELESDFALEVQLGGDGASSAGTIGRSTVQPSLSSSNESSTEPVNGRVIHHSFRRNHQRAPDGGDAGGERPPSVLSGEGPGVDVDAPREAVQGIPYTWSSRGPVADGAIGVSICAPGGAIAPVPAWMLQKKMLLNGTSMSSPSAAGAIACILSFLKQRGIAYTSAFVRRAIECTARPLGLAHLGGMKTATDGAYFDDLVFAGGSGSVDALAACRYLESFANEIKREPVKQHGNGTLCAGTKAGGALGSSFTGRKFIPGRQAREIEMLSPRYWQLQVRVSELAGGRKSCLRKGVGCLNTTRGIYLRGKAETSTPQRMQVHVEPISPDDESVLTKNARANMEIIVYLESSAPWVKVPNSLLLLGTGRAFKICVDPTDLEVGRAHFAEIRGYLQPRTGKEKRFGPLFKVPVTVTKPEELLNGTTITPLCNLAFSPGAVVRRFYTVPVGATFAMIRVTAGASNFAPRPANASVPEDKTKGYALKHMPPASWPGETGANPVNTTPVSVASSYRSSLPPRNEHIDRENSSWAPAGTGAPAINSLITPGTSEREPIYVTSNTEDSRYFELHLVQISPQKSCKETEARRYVTLRPGAEKDCYAKVSGGTVIELCIAQMWSSPGATIVERMEMTFCGLRVEPSALVASPMAGCFPRVEVFNQLPPSVVSKDILSPQNLFAPSAMMRCLQRVVSPQKYSIRSLGKRDEVSPLGSLAELKLEYTFEVFDSSSQVKISFPGINKTSFESEVDGGPYVIIVDVNRRIVALSDISRKMYSLSKGVYFVDAYLCHDSIEQLDHLRELRAIIEYRLTQALLLKPYQTTQGALLGISSRKISTRGRTLESGEGCAFYLASPKKTALPHWAASGDLLVGDMEIDKAGEDFAKQKSGIPTYPLYFSVQMGPAVAKKVVRPSLMKKITKDDEPEEQKTDSDRDSDTPPGRDSNPPSPCRTDNEAEGSGVGLAAVASGDSEDKTGGDDKKDDDKWLREAISKAKIKQLKSLVRAFKFEDFDSLCNPMMEETPEDFELLGLHLERLEAEALRHQKQNAGNADEFKVLVDKVVVAADNIITRINATELAAQFYMLPDPEAADESTKKKKLDDKKGYLLAALFRKTRILERCVPEGKDGEEDAAKAGNKKEEASSKEADPAKASNDEAFIRAIKELGRWVTIDGWGVMPVSATNSATKIASTSSEDLALVGAKREMRRKRYGSALKILDAFYGPPPFKQKFSEKTADLRLTILNALGWEHAADHEKRRKIVRFPMQWPAY